MQLAIIGLILSHNRASYCLSMYNFNIWKHPVMVRWLLIFIFDFLGTENNVTTLVKETKAEHFSQFREAFKNCSSELFFGPFERLILIFSAIFWYCMITRQLIVKKNISSTFKIPPTSVKVERAFSRSDALSFLRQYFIKNKST
jgi:hypothetical protein